MDFRLKAFMSVARNLSFTRAAQELYVSQPAITKHIKELEHSYGVRLFDRESGGISLTEAGRIMLRHSEAIEREYNNMEYDLHRLNGSHAGLLRIGVSTTIAQYILPSVLAAFAKQYPDIHISMVDTNSQGVEQLLKEQSLDLGMTEGAYRRGGLDYQPVLRDELVVISRTGNKLAGNGELTIDQLRTLPFVLREQGSGTLDVIAHALEKAGVSLPEMNVRLHLGGTESIKRFVCHSDTFGIVSVFSVIEELKSGLLRIVDVDGLTFERRLHFVTKQGKNTEIADLFQRFACDYMANDTSMRGYTLK